MVQLSVIIQAFLRPAVAIETRMGVADGVAFL